MNQSLQDRLRRLGITRGTRDLKPAAKRRDKPGFRDGTQTGLPAALDESAARSIEALFPSGRVEITADGACFIVDRVYPISYEHGGLRLSALLEFSTAELAFICQDERLAEAPLQEFLFLDTETTGLGGAGTLAFMVGVAFFEQGSSEDVLVVRQYFLRDHGDEAAMLTLLDDLLASKAGLVTFNGRSFDLPLLNNRFLMNRMPSDLLAQPHADLLPLSRKLWRQRLGSVALGNLEKNVLGVQRSHDDVPGWLIPGLYNDYLRSGDGRELRRVFYHNQIDMLSMVTLTAEIVRMFTTADHNDHPIDLFSLGKWQANLGMIEDAETKLRSAAAADLPLNHYHLALQQLGQLLKKNDRRSEAVLVWQQWAASSLDDVTAFIELAKHFEWHEQDLEMALSWTERALALAGRGRRSRNDQLLPELQHRLARLRRKLNQ